MFFKNLRTQKTALTLALAIGFLSTELAARSSDHGLERVHQFITPAQAILQDTTALPIADNQPISFGTINIIENIKLEQDNSVFEVKVPGKYEIDLTITVTNPVATQTYVLAVLINGQSYLNFQTNELAFSSAPINIFGGAIVYLEKGDEISVVFLNPPAGTILGKRTFNMINDNNTR